MYVIVHETALHTCSNGVYSFVSLRKNTFDSSILKIGKDLINLATHFVADNVIKQNTEYRIQNFILRGTLLN